MTRNLALAISYCFAVSVTASAQNVAPVVTTPIAPFTVYAGAAGALDSSHHGVCRSGCAQRGATERVASLKHGTFTIALDGQHKPVTVGNFLNYANFGRYFATDPTTHMLASSFIHRSVPGFVVQSCEFMGTVNPAHPNNARPTPVMTFPPIQNEPGISSKTGTVAMAKIGGDPNSATSQWFVNLANNGGPPANLDTQNGGFTVFGHVTGNGMTTVNAIAAVPIFNFGSPFDSLPLRNYTAPNSIKVANLVSINSIALTPPLTFRDQRQRSSRNRRNQREKPSRHRTTTWHSPHHRQSD